MSCIEHPVEVAATPSRQEFEPDVENGRDRTRCPQREGVDVPALDSRH